MTLDQIISDDDAAVRQYQYHDGNVLAVDFGPAVDGSVDVVADTVIVVIGDEQYELDLDGAGDAHTFIKNGVLTIETEAEV
ncbi:DUF7127 family protein [Natrarchaeobaculum aegyptiacum]|uniref:Hsp20/alpha crystallin family protein n=1 Tax=Natrarchaeobaculum aegyptiacum TaxID=745377 RepID=A0A2Z2HPZ0_9EURY|nr:hypothetical protein [Natrarchaeobaculum aegyptiacum]ARS89091.1 hypothetical protein B1756_04505 [Natrarchaeobaculum aegyptiacum]